MRIPIATTVVGSTLATFALYQGFATFFPHLVHPDDGSASDAKKDATKAEQAKTTTKGAIAAPEKMPVTKVAARANTPIKTGQLVARGSLPTVNVPPTMRSLPTPFTARPNLDNSAMQNAPDAAMADADNQRQLDALDQSKPNAGIAQSLPFTSVDTPLSDVKGHWAESYIDSLAAKGVIRGFSDGSFHPDEMVTAGQFTLMTQKAFTASPVTYTDLQQLHPDRTPTRADAAAFIYQALAKGQSAPLTMAVQVSGAVPRPGIYTIANGSRVDSPIDAGVPTVARAIQRAGGALDGANLHQVQIQRISETSARQTINVDVRQLLQKGDRSHDIVLQQGDKLFIPAAPSTAANNVAPPMVATPERPISMAESTKLKELVTH